MPESRTSTNVVYLIVLAGLVMAYGWGYRGVTGSERGAMAAGAMLGLAVCLGSNREDWQRRAAVAGMFGAVGWAWGGSFSYMEQTFYTVSDSFRDVLFGYTALFLLGALWAGIGGSVLGLAFTLPRSQLERFARVFFAISFGLLATFLWFVLRPGRPEFFATISQVLPNSGGKWYTAIMIILVGGIWSLVRPSERREAFVFIMGAVGWLLGYTILTYLPSKILPFPGTSLGPPYRLETWSGILGVLAALIVYLRRERNRAALMLCYYGILGGGLGFPLAVFVRHPVRVEWGIFAPMRGQFQWKIAEESFGLFMGIAIALGVLRFARVGLAPAPEDTPRKRLDVWAAFVMLVGILWLNLRRTPVAWIERYEIFPREPVGGLLPWVWFTIGGTLLAGLMCYALYLYSRDRFVLAPQGAYAKGVLILLFMMWVTTVSSLAQNVVAERGFLWTEVSFISICTIVTAMLFTPRAPVAADPPDATVAPDDNRWNVGKTYWLVWVCVPFVLLTITVLSMAMQEGPAERARLRFGPDAYWREATRVSGTWLVTGIVEEPRGEIAPANNPPFTQVTFQENGAAILTMPDGTVDADSHGWHHADSWLWLDWLGRQRDNPDAKNIRMAFEDGKFYIPWPPRGDLAYYLVLEKQEDG